jgi:hypothetical protein
MADIPVKAIPKDHPYRRDFSRWEREFQEAMERALNKWRIELFRDIDGDNVRDVLYRMQQPKYRNILQDAVLAQLQKVALAGADNGRRVIEKEVFGVS